MSVYGTCELVGRVWMFDIEPHVAMRLRRMFPGAKGKGRRAMMTDNDANCRDIAWFCERYPIEIKSRDKLDAHASRHRAGQELAHAIMSGTRREGRRFELALPPRQYQVEAAELLLARRRLLLADDMGLGKTVSAICPLMEPATRPALVVTLAGLIPKQWEAEINRFAPSLRVHVAKKGTPYDMRPYKFRKRDTSPQADLFGDADDGFPDVVIMTYAKVSGWAATLANVVKYVVFDEAQELRRTGTAKYNGAKEIADTADFVMGLTGTPIYNYGEEFHPVLDAVNADCLGTMGEFSDVWCSGRMINDPGAFGSFLRDEGIMLRRTRKEVGRELPGLTVVPHEVEADHAVLAKAQGRASELARIILGGFTGDKSAKMRASEELSVLVRQQTGIAKAHYVASFVRLVLEQEKNLVLYGWHRAVYDIWREELAEFSPAFITGEESVAQKQRAKDAFIEGRSRVLIVSLRAGAGLDGLQHATRTVVFGELDWSAGIHDQATDRVNRDGQQDPVIAYYLIADSGSDPIVADVLGVKRRQLEPVRNPDGEVMAEVDPERVRRLAEVYA